MFKGICTDIKMSAPSSYDWEWDNRFGTVLLCLKAADSPPVREKLSVIFQKQFEITSLRQATGPEKKLFKALSGIKKGQIVFTHDHKETIFYGAWWPWGDERRVSLRLGIYSPGADAEFKQQAEVFLKNRFSL